MKDLLKRIKTNALLTAAVYSLLGLVLLVWPGLSTDLFCTALGAVFLLCGAVDIFTFLTHRDGSLYSSSQLVLGVILAVVGVYLMTRPGIIAMVIPRIIGILICIHGIRNLGDAITLHRNGYARWSTALLLAILTVALGTILIANPFQAFQTVVRIIGIFRLYDGISDIWITTRVSSVLKQMKTDSEAEASAVDVDYKDVP